jgi:hypothetical protein
MTDIERPQHYTAISPLPLSSCFLLYFLDLSYIHTKKHLFDDERS